METKKKILLILVLAFGLIVCLPKVGQAAPMGTAFTYQSRLIDANKPADGLYDFQFKLFDDPNVVIGKKIGGDVNVADLDVIDGYFAVELDFGSGVFDGNERWLEMGVRPGDQNDPNVYTALSPRQKVTPTPYALAIRAPLSLVSGGSEPTISGIATAQYNGIGVYGEATRTDGYGVYGKATGMDSYGVYGEATAEDSEAIFGFASGQAYSAVAGQHGGHTAGYLGHQLYGVYGGHVTNVSYGSIVDPYGYLGGAIHGVYGGTINPDNYAGYFDGQTKVTKNLIVDGNVGIGTSTPTDKLDVAGHINSSESYKLDGDTVLSNTGKGSNIFVGRGAGYSNTEGMENTFLGVSSGYSNITGCVNTFTGYLAGASNTTGWGNTFSGNYAGKNAKGDNNIFLGVSAGYYNITGTGNVFIGYRAGFNETGSNKLYIANSDTTVPLIYGDFLTGNVGIGTTSPAAKLEVAGQVKITGGSPSAGKVLISDAAGLATWTNLPAGGDITAVNAGTGLSGGGTSGDVTLAVSVPLSLTGSVASPAAVFDATNTGNGYGVKGTCASSISGTGVYGYNNGTGNYGYLGGMNGVYGYNNGTGNYGYLGGMNGVYGSSTNGTGVGGFSTNGYGASGSSTSGTGVYGSSTSGNGVYGYNSTGGNYGYLGSGSNGVYGHNSSGNYGYLGTSDYGASGYNSSGNLGYLGTSSQGVFGINSSGSFGSLGSGNTGVFGYGGAYDFYAGGPGTNYGSPSSIRWKSDVRPIDEPLDKVMALRGVYFNWDAEHGGQHDVGMVAEEVGEVLPEIVVYEPNSVYTSGMDYSKLTPLLVEAVKALKTEVDQLQKENADLRNRVETMEKMMTGGSGLQIGVK